MAGTGVIVLSVLYAALRFRGRTGERFSLLNHFISELGEVGVSRGAWAFNGGLVLTGVLLIPFVVHLGIVLGSVLGWVGAFFAAAASLGAAAVGIFPMNNLKPHVRAAMTYFYGGLAMVLAIGAAVLIQPDGRVVIHKVAGLLSLLAALAFGSFLALPRFTTPGVDPLELLDPQIALERPRFWALPFLEWVVFFTTIFWLSGMAFFA
jgi:hypothetical membrane protein